MNVIIYAIYDQAVKAFTTPKFTTTEGAAVRQFSDNINTQEDNLLNQHPEQFSLYKIGEYDDNTGAITPCDPQLVITAKQLLNRQTTNQDIKRLIDAVNKLTQEK